MAIAGVGHAPGRDAKWLQCVAVFTSGGAAGMGNCISVIILDPKGVVIFRFKCLKHLKLFSF